MKIDNSVQHQFLIRFLEISGLKAANIDVSTSYLLQVSPTVKIKLNDMLTHSRRLSFGVQISALLSNQVQDT